MHNRWAYPGKPSSPSKRAATHPVLPLPSNWPASSTPPLRAYLNGTRLSTSGASSSAAGLAGSAQIEALYESASRLPPVSEAPDVAHSSARLDGHARHRDDVPAVGFACGYSWSCEVETDDWSWQFRYRLGLDSVAVIQKSFSSSATGVKSEVHASRLRGRAT